MPKLSEKSCQILTKAAVWMPPGLPSQGLNLASRLKGVWTKASPWGKAGLLGVGGVAAAGPSVAGLNALSNKFNPPPSPPPPSTMDTLKNWYGQAKGEVTNHPLAYGGGAAALTAIPLLMALQKQKSRKPDEEL
jgi:subtilisin family serine protease